MAAAEVTMTSDSDVSAFDRDGPIYYLKAPEKTLIINLNPPNATFNKRIAAGYADDSDIETLSGYTITITENGGNFTDDLIGAYNFGGKEATNNQVIFKNGTSGKIIGGWAPDTTADNTVTISGGKVTEVYGGYSFGTTTRNKVYITGGEVISGGQIYGGYSDGRSADNNSVEISGGTIDGTVYGGYNEQEHADSNSVEISGGTINGRVYGGYAEDTDKHANNNSVEISDGTINGRIYGGYSSAGSATNNQVIISGGKLSNGSDVHGGYAFSSGQANNNTVTISGNLIFDDPNSGTSPSVVGGHSSDGEASNNTVNLLTSVTLYKLAGGEASPHASSTGNTLNVAAKGNTVKYLNNFQNLNFFLPENIAANDTMLTVTDGSVSIDGVTVRLAANSQALPTNLIIGNTITLLKDEQGIVGALTTGTIDNTVNVTLPTSITAVDTYKFTIEKETDDKSITATLNSINTGTGIGSDPVVINNASDINTYLQANNETLYYLKDGPKSLTLNGNYGNERYGYAAGYSDTQEVHEYTLTVKGGQFGGTLYGGYAANNQANNNKLIISGGTVGNNASVNGGQGKTGAKENEVTISGGTLTGMVHGGWAESGPAFDNQVTVEGGTLSGRIYGGRTDSGNANNNTVTIKGGVLNHTGDYIILGGWADNGNTNNNTVTISGGTVSGGGEIYGGRGGSGVNNNTVTISGTANFTGQPSVYGGFVDGYGTASNNTVNLLTKVTLDSLVGGGFTAGNSTDNTLNVAAKDITVSSLSGFQNLNFFLPADIASGNTMLTVTNGSVSIDGVTVRLAANSQALPTNLIVGNTITLLKDEQGINGALTTGTIDNTVTATLPTSITAVDTYKFTIEKKTDNKSITATLNSINTGIGSDTAVINSASDINTYLQAYNETPYYLKDGPKSLTLNGNYGDKRYGYAAGYSDTQEVHEYTLTINGGEFNNTQNLYGGYGVGNYAANNNHLVVNGGTIASNIYGGQSINGGASQNTVSITGGEINSYIYGGYSGSGSANKNEVSITGGKLSSGSFIYGGYSYSGNASNNTVTISKAADTSEKPSVCGGYSYQGQANDNTVNLLTKVTLSSLRGGGSSSDSGQGNTLNVAAKGSSADTLNQFQNLNFYLPTDITPSDTMLTVSNATVSGATVGVLAQGTLSNLSTGETVNLLTASQLEGTITPGTITTTVPTGITTVDTYNFSINQTANAITAKLDSIKSDSGSGDSGSGGSGSGGSGSGDSGSGGSGDSGSGDSAAAERRANTKSMVETRAATTTLLNAGADMLAGQGFQQAANAVALAAAEANTSSTGTSSTDTDNARQSEAAPAPRIGFTPYATLGGSSLRAESGSHVDTKTWGINVGFAREISNKNGKLLFGPLVEYGRGSYDSYLDNGTHGKGDSSYWGLGVMARQVNHDGLYYEGSLRGGRVKSDYSGNVNTLNVNYDSSSNYIAAHLGLGKITKLSKDNKLDCYVKYFYTRQSGDDVTMHATGVPDETYKFDSVTSHRLRLGARLTHKLNEKSSLYGGLAYQYEFDGDARATYNGTSTPSPSVKGGSGMLELGWQVKPGSSPMTLDLGLTGWAGKQRGLTGQIGMMWKF